MEHPIPPHQMITSAVISFTNVTFAYNGEPAIIDADLTVETNEMVALVGPNGGGKTTILRLILGLLRPQRGDVRVLGATPRRARRYVGYVPQHVRHDPQFPVNVMDVVLMGRAGNRWGGRYSRADRRAVFEALGDVDMEGRASRSFANLSGGERQRVLIARALASSPTLLLLDEPTSHVDTAAEQKLYDLLEHLNERLTIVLVSHDIGVVSKLVSKVVCVNHHVMTHSTGELTGEVIQELYDTDVAMVVHDHHNQGESNIRVVQ